MLPDRQQLGFSISEGNSAPYIRQVIGQFAPQACAHYVVIIDANDPTGTTFGAPG